MDKTTKKGTLDDPPEQLWSIDELFEMIAEQGLDGLPKLIRIVINAAMQAERRAYLPAAPNERTP